MKVRRNTKNGKPYGNFFIALGGGRREMLDTRDKAVAEQRMKLFAKTGSWRDPNAKPIDPLGAFDAPPPAPLALLPAIESPPPPAPAASSPPPPPPQSAPAGDDWVADMGARGPRSAPPADDEDDLDPEVAKELLEVAGNVLVEAQLMAQAWLLRRYKRIEAAPVDPEHQLRKIGRKAWATQFKRWWPDLNIPAWAVALGATGMTVMVQVGEGATASEAPAARPRPAASSSSTTSAPPAEAAAA